MSNPTWAEFKSFRTDDSWSVASATSSAQTVTKTHKCGVSRKRPSTVRVANVDFDVEALVEVVTGAEH